MSKFFGGDEITNRNWEEERDNNGGSSRHGSFHMQSTNLLPQQNTTLHSPQDPGANRSSAVGLKLSKSSSLLDFLAARAPNPNDTNTTPRHRPQYQASVPQEAPLRIKAMNFPMSAIIIGTWGLVATNHGDLTVKCYFAKKKLVWEILGLANVTHQNGRFERLKSKLEMEWSDVVSLSPIFRENQSSELSVELSNPPRFYHEREPQPKRHTQWDLAEDFTNGQASHHSRHKLFFDPGVLEKFYDKLMSSDTHLRHCSQVPFPSFASPYFASQHFFGDKEGNNVQSAPMNLTNPHHDIRHYRVLPEPPQGPFPMDEEAWSSQNQVMANGGNQFLVRDKSQENFANALPGTQVNPLFQDGAHHTEALLGRRVNSWDQDQILIDAGDSDGLHESILAKYGQEGFLETQDNSVLQGESHGNAKRPRSDLEGNFQDPMDTETTGMPLQYNTDAPQGSYFQEALFEMQDNSLVQGASHGNVKRPRSDLEGNFQAPMIPELTGMPLQYNTDAGRESFLQEGFFEAQGNLRVREANHENAERPRSDLGGNFQAPVIPETTGMPLQYNTDARRGSFFQEGSFEAQGNSLVRGANQENTERPRSDLEGNVQAPVIPETTGMPLQDKEEDLDSAIQRALSDFNWEFGDADNTDNAAQADAGGFYDMSFMNSGPFD